MKSKSPIIPGDLATTKEEFEARLDFARRQTGSIHLDVADGRFVGVETYPIDSWPPLAIEYAEAHLMVRRPIDYLASIRAAGVTRAIVHVESYFDLDELIEAAKRADILIGFAVNPDTDLDLIKPFLEYSNYIQVMGIEPGRTGQTMLQQTELAVSYLRRLPNRRLIISVDGGVRKSNIPLLSKLGANYFISSSALYDHGDWTENLAALVQETEQ